MSTRPFPSGSTPSPRQEFMGNATPPRSRTPSSSPVGKTPHLPRLLHELPPACLGQAAASGTLRACRRSPSRRPCATSKCRPGVGQGALRHPVADAFGAHGAEDEVLAVGAGAAASDEHGRTMAGCGTWRGNKIYFMALHFLPRPRIRRFQAEIRETGTDPPPIPAPGGKDGIGYVRGDASVVHGNRQPASPDRMVRLKSATALIVNCLFFA